MTNKLKEIKGIVLFINKPAGRMLDIKNMHNFIFLLYMLTGCMSFTIDGFSSGDTVIFIILSGTNRKLSLNMGAMPCDRAKMHTQVSYY